MGTKGGSPPSWPSSALARRLADTHTMALTPRQYRSHMLRKRGWPPMSQSCDGEKKEVASPAALPTCPKTAPFPPPRPPAPALRPKREAPGLIKTEEIPMESDSPGCNEPPVVWRAPLAKPWGLFPVPTAPGAQRVHLAAQSTRLCSQKHCSRQRCPPSFRLSCSSRHPAHSHLLLQPGHLEDPGWAGLSPPFTLEGPDPSYKP